VLQSGHRTISLHHQENMKSDLVPDETILYEKKTRSLRKKPAGAWQKSITFPAGAPVAPVGL